MSTDIDTDIEASGPGLDAPTIAPSSQDAMADDSLAAQSDLADPLNDELSDSDVDDGGDSVQMLVPPKPGVGPKATDAFQTVEEVLSTQPAQ